MVKFELKEEINALTERCSKLQIFFDDTEETIKLANEKNKKDSSNIY